MKAKSKTDDTEALGGVCGLLTEGGTLTNCSSEAELIDTYKGYAGGVAGEVHGTVTDCYSTADVKSSFAISGGVAGYLNGQLIRCGNKGKEVSSGETHGGIVGIMESENSLIENCYNNAFVRTTYSEEGYRYGSGGFAGKVTGGLIKGCYNSGTVDQAKDANAVIGINEGGRLEKCYSTAVAGYEGVTKASGIDKGELAYMLQSNLEDPSVQIWGQNLHYDDSRDLAPILTNDPEKKFTKQSLWNLAQMENIP